MRRWIFSALLIISAASTAGAEPYKVLHWDDRSITVEFTISDPVVTPLDKEETPSISHIRIAGFPVVEREGRPVLPARRFFFEVPSLRGVKLDVLEQEISRIDGVLPRLFRVRHSPDEQKRRLIRSRTAFQRPFVRFSGVRTFRHRNIACVDLFPVSFDAEGGGIFHLKHLVIRLSFPPPPYFERMRPEKLPRDNLIVNTEQASAWRGWRPEGERRQRMPFEFALSDNWIRISVAKKGIYIVDYSDLLAAGVDPATINPATLRLYSSSPFPQPDSIGRGGSFRDDYHLSPIDIHYRGEGAEGFLPGDEIIFYGLGVEGWAGDADASGDRREYMKHPYETRNFYWLTWNGEFSGTPARMETRGVAPTGSADLNVSTYEERLHIEEDHTYDAMHTDDRWYWLRVKSGISPYYSYSFDLSDIAGQEGVFRTLGYGPYQKPNPIRSVDYYMNGLFVDSLAWYVDKTYKPQRMKRLEAPLTNLAEGVNTVRVHNTSGGDGDIYILWFEIFYERSLKAVAGELDFYAPDSAGIARFELTGFPPGEILLFDVTDSEKPVLLSGWQPAAGGLRFEDQLDGTASHYISVSTSSLKRTDLELASVPSLRDETVCPHMLIIYHRRFRDAAMMLKNHREGSLPYAENPVVKAVDIKDIYNNFSGGLKDPVAIRNYLKFLYDNFSESGEPVLKYVLFIGNGNYDPRDILGKGTDFIPLYINLNYSYQSEGVEEDDFFVKLDDVEDSVPDIAVGRLTPLHEGEADAWVRRIIEYESSGESGPWRNKLIFIADDEYSSFPFYDFSFIYNAEDLASDDGPLPIFMDVKKIYLHHYPFLGDAKPDANRDLLNEWSAGALVASYAGHGSSEQMADERVMLNSDIYKLTNGMRRPLVLSFSCSTGDLDSPLNRSMAQNMSTYEGGGAIGTMCAAAPTLGEPNSALNWAVFKYLFASKYSTETEPIGYALQLAKMNLIDSLPQFESNNSKYMLVGDPAMKLTYPEHTIEHDISLIDTMYTGFRYELSGSVITGGGTDTTFDGVAEVIVQESEQVIDKVVLRGGIGYHVDYSLPGKEFFRGKVDVERGRFKTSFVVPRRCRTGSRARIRSYVSSSSSDGIGACDTLRIKYSETVPDNPDAPRISLYFENRATRIKPGSRLIADIYDKDGVAILGTEPQNSILLEFDGTGLPYLINDYFEYDRGSSTRGRVEYPLNPELQTGKHRVVMKAFDNLGASASDTLDFEIIERGLFQVSDVFCFPNPLSESTNFVFQLSDVADVRLTVFNLSGVKIWEERVRGEEGFNSIYWDARDMAGDRPANGTYIYLLDVDFEGAFSRTEKVKGKVIMLR